MDEVRREGVYAQGARYSAVVVLRDVGRFLIIQT